MLIIGSLIQCTAVCLRAQNNRLLPNAATYFYLLQGSLNDPSQLLRKIFVVKNAFSSRIFYIRLRNVARSNSSLLFRDKISKLARRAFPTGFLSQTATFTV